MSLRCGERTLWLGQVSCVVYTNWKGETAERRIRPLRLWYGTNEWHLTPQWLLDAYDLDRDAERSFALDGIREVKEGD